MLNHNMAILENPYELDSTGLGIKDFSWFSWTEGISEREIAVHSVRRIRREIFGDCLHLLRAFARDDPHIVAERDHD